ncbi:MAG: hypothetical protein WEE89_07630 [Gemmatimonadota bacterium]
MCNGSVLVDASVSEVNADTLAPHFSTIAERCPHARLRVLLSPELCELRLIELPPLPEEDAVRALTRDARRHFVTAFAEPVIGVLRQKRGSPSVMAAVEQSTTDTIQSAAAAAGYASADISPMGLAWSVQPGVLVVMLEDSIEVIQTDDGGVRDIRRLPVGRTDLVSAVAPGETTALDGRAAESGIADRDAFVAAATSARPSRLHFETEMARARTRSRLRRQIGLGWAAVLLLLATAALLEHGNLSRELGAVARQRASIRAVADSALAVRSKAQTATGHIHTAESLHRATNWSPLLVMLARGLPAGASLAGINAERDTLKFELLVDNAVEAIEALKDSPDFADLQVVGSIHRQVSADDTHLEQFIVAVPVQRIGRGR